MVLFKTAVSLEETGKVQIVALDKTGTITNGEPVVTDMVPAEGVTEESLLALAASLEKRSEHPLAKAILKYVGEQHLTVEDVSEFEALPGNGLTAVRNGDLDGMISRMGNVFEPGIISKYPVIQEIKDLMESNGARKAMMSGSGPTVFGIFDDKEKMERAAAVLRESRLAKTVFAADVF